MPTKRKSSSPKILVRAGSALITGTGQAWRVPASLLVELIKNANPAGRCKVEVWSTGSSSLPGDLKLLLLLQSGWCDMIPTEPPENPGGGPGVGKAWSVSVNSLILLIANHDDNDACKVEVWSALGGTIPTNLKLWLLLQTGWCDMIPTEPPGTPTHITDCC